MPKKKLVCLDEVFGSLSLDMSRLCAEYIRLRVFREDWEYCVIASNRPDEFYDIFDRV